MKPKPVYIKAELHARLKAAAAKAGKKLAEHVEEVLRRREVAR